MREYVVDITRKGVAPVVQVTEFDSMSRFFTLILMDGGVPYEEPEGSSYSVFYETADGKGWYDTITLPDSTTRPAVTADGNEYTIEIAEAATTACGELALCITAPGGYQLTVAGIITRSADIPGYDGEEVENYYNVFITEMRENAARAENAAATAIEYGAMVEVDEDAQQLNITHTDNTGDVQTWVTEAEAWSVGQRDGVDVPNTDETYHNNAKYYAQVAQESAQGASAIVTEASGSVAAFSDGANDVAVKSLVAEITPILSGNGDPSPTNVRAISGRTGMTVTRSGKNLLEGLEVGNIDQTTGQDITGTAVRSVGYVGVLPNQTYTISGLLIEGGVIRLFTYAQDKTYIGTQTINFSGYVAQFSVDAYYVRFQSSDATFNATTPVQVEVGSTATPYTPYVAPIEIPITWQTEAGTIYGGTLDVVSGVLTVTHAAVDMGTLDFDAYSTPSNHVFRCVLPVPAPAAVPSDSTPDAICSRYTAMAYNPISASDNGKFAIGTRADRLVFIDNTVSTVAAFEEAVTGQTLVYPLATPTTYQLTPTEVKTLLGGNTIYTDAGSVSVDYVADTKMYIDNKVAELQALILEN